MKKNLLFSIVIAFFAFTLNGHAKSVNLVFNGNFNTWISSDATPEHWDIAQGVTQNSNDYHSAPYSVEQASNSSVKKLSQKIKIKGGKTYVISFWYKTKKKGDGTDCRIWSTFNGTMTSLLKAKLQGPNNKYLPNSRTWRKFSTIVTAPKDATEFVLEVRTYKKAVILWDDFSVIEKVITHPVPFMHVHPTNIIDLGYIIHNPPLYKNPSVVRKISIKGENLKESVIVGASKKFEISKESSNAYFHKLKLPVNKNGKIDTYIKVRLRNIFPLGEYSGNLYVSTKGVTTKNVNLKANVVSNIVDLPFVEDFGRGIIPMNWTNYNKVGEKLWNVYSNDKLNISTAFMFTDFIKKEKNTVWLITPKLRLKKEKELDVIDKPIYITFDVLSALNTGAELLVFISDNFDGTNIGAAKWKNITSNFKIPKNTFGEIKDTDIRDIFKIKFVNAGIMKLKASCEYMHLAFVYVGENSDINQKLGIYCIDNVKIDRENVTSTLNLSENKLEIYPNPADNYILLNEKAKLFEIINLTGKTVLIKNNIESNKKIDISTLNSGMYIIKINNGKDTKVFKFTKK